MTRPSLGILWLVFTSTTALAGDPVEFNRDIRPILAENCFLCHGPDASHRKADLRLDNRASAITKEAIIPGKVDASELMARIHSVDPEEVMPPPDSTKSLTPTQKDLLKRWIEQGATYQSHWAYEPIKRPPVPRVKDPSWVQNPIDAFILGALETKGIKPSIEADRRTLLRRLSLDLIGLPPTVEELRNFEADPAPNAYEKQVDRLLASPHYGERMAVPWLDLVRFADTVGYHGDQNQHIFPYRDYVIDAFNRNLPFDQFTLEQLAGDLLPNPTTEQIIATGFNRLNMMTREGGAQPKEYLAKYAGDRVRTVSNTWLGSTMGCAECHDHKFDPFAARDFYRMAAFFADVKQWGVYMDYGYTPNPELRGYSNDHPFPPEIEVDSPYLNRRITRIDRQIRDALTAGAGRISTDQAKVASFIDWAASARKVIEGPDRGWRFLDIAAGTTPAPDGRTFLEKQGGLLIQGEVKPKEITKVALNLPTGWMASLRLELLPDPDHGGKIIRGKVPPTISLAVKVSGRSDRIDFLLADADAKIDRYQNGSSVLGILGGWRVPASNLDSRHFAVYQLQKPIRIDKPVEMMVELKGDGLGCVRFSASPLVFDDVRHPDLKDSLVQALRAEPASRTVEQSALLQTEFLKATGADSAAFTQYQNLALERRECRDGKALTMVTQSQTPLPTRVLPRGNWQDESGDLLTPGVPKFLPQPPDSESRRLSRVDLARWLTSTENPLTARVFANRLWKQFFGNGLSAVMEDLGAQGEWPSHPELLDWLASDFRDGWNIKGLVKQMVMSATYRQDSRLRAELRDSDPANRLLSSQNPRRLEAEFIRDNALCIADLIDHEVGGPSARPYQPGGYYAILQFPDRDYAADRDDRQYRRGVYAHWQRTFLQPMLANFDAPGREECIASRVVANTPQQALTLLNDPTFVEAARVLAGHLVTSTLTTDESKLDRLFEKALGRRSKPKEQASLLAFLAKARIEAREHSDDLARLLKVGLAPNPTSVDLSELAAWTEVCRVVLNLHESITRY